VRVLGVVLLVITCGMLAQEIGGGVRFTYVDVHVDSGASPLAAYQVEVACVDPAVKLVGVEGGEARHFAEAPYYDPAALQGGQVVLGAFTVEGDAPAGRQRVARLHYQEPEGPAPRFEAKLVTAAAPGGSRIEVKVELEWNGGTK